MNRYAVTYNELSTGKIMLGIYEALSISDLVFVLECKLGYVPDVKRVVKM
jgi:hypothetical protein